MSILSKLASIYIPDSEKKNKLFQLLTEFLISTYEILIKEYGNNKAKEILTEISKEVGKKAADLLRKELKMENGYESALQSWKIGCQLLNFKIHIVKGEKGTEFYHDYDPLWQMFKEKDLILCEYVCLPMVDAMAKEFDPECESEYLQKPSLTSPCVKLLRFKK